MPGNEPPTGPGGWAAREQRARRRRWLIAAALLAGVLIAATAGFTAYAAAVGGAWVIHPDDKSADCRTPMQQFGWPYEAVNYEIAGDTLLAPRESLRNGRWVWSCPVPGAPAGDAIVTTDGVGIAGWYIPAANGETATGPTILLVHGRSADKSEILRYAVGLHDAWNVLVIDLRNGGQSGGTETTMGIRERLDVLAALDWLEREKHPAWVAAVGVSLGGSAIAAAAAEDDRIRALVLDSVHARITDALAIGVHADRGLPEFPTGWAMATGASLMLEEDISAADPIRTIPTLGDRPVLFLHGTADPYDLPQRSVELNLQAARDAGVPAEVHYCEGAGHAAVVDRCRVEWGAWVRAFLASALAGDPAWIGVASIS